ncbi:hypothetical protein RUND412_011280 [Rhizina undulata]
MTKPFSHTSPTKSHFSPSRLLYKSPQKPISPSKLSTSQSLNPTPKSTAARHDSPSKMSDSKMSDFEFIGSDEDEAFDEVDHSAFAPRMSQRRGSGGNGFNSAMDLGGDGDDTISSNFSDVTVGAIGGTSGNLFSPSKSKAFTGSPVKTIAGLGNSPEKNKSPEKASARKSISPPRKTPPKRPANSATTTPRTAVRQKHDNNSSSSPTATPHTPANSNSTNLLLDFTQQFDAISRKPPASSTPSHRRQRLTSPSKASPTKAPLPPSTPTENRFFNLLDFTPGPVATPRSLPTITPREMEELKSEFQTQISQLRAELNGREAEICGLRDAVREAEGRCGGLREEMKLLQEKFHLERESWDGIKQEMGDLFEVVKREKEVLSEELAVKTSQVREINREVEERIKEVEEKEKELDEANRKLENQTFTTEELLQRVKLAEEEAAKAKEETLATKEASSENPAGAGGIVAKDTQTEIERVARELHSLYKAKHETKVAALKKSYEARWEKKVLVLQTDVSNLTKRNEELEKELEERRQELSNESPPSYSAPSHHVPPSSSSSAEKDLEIQKLQREVVELRSLLEIERKEKGELVGAVEEMLSIQAQVHAEGRIEPDVKERMSRSMRRVSGMGVATVEESPIRGGLREGIEQMGRGRGAH